MKWTRTICGFALLLWLSLAAAQTETAYVTDNLRLGLHRAADTSDRAFRTLESGQPMQILSRTANYAQVRLPDGTTGYVKSAYLVSDKPAKLIVEETQSANAALQADLDSVREQFAGSAGRIAELESALSTAESRVAGQQDELDALKRENADFEQKMALYGFSLPWPIALGAMLITLVLGFFAGTWWLDYRSRKRHGGFRIY